MGLHLGKYASGVRTEVTYSHIFDAEGTRNPFSFCPKSVVSFADGFLKKWAEKWAVVSFGQDF